MSLFSKIGKGLKRLKFKKVAPWVAVAGGLLIPGVGAAVIGGLKAAGHGAGKLIKTAGGIVRQGATSAGDLAGTLKGEVGSTSSAVEDAARKVEEALAEARGSVQNFESSAGQRFAQGALASIPSIVWIGAALIVVLLIVRRK